MSSIYTQNPLGGSGMGTESADRSSAFLTKSFTSAYNSADAGPAAQSNRSNNAQAPEELVALQTQLNELFQALQRLLMQFTAITSQLQNATASQMQSTASAPSAMANTSDIAMSPPQPAARSDNLFNFKVFAGGDATSSAPADGVSPPDAPTESIAAIASASDDFNILTRALDAAGLTDAVATGDDLTVFAPTDEAFGHLAQDLGFKGDTANEDKVFDFLVGQLTELGNGDPIPLLSDILKYHVSAGAKASDDLGDGGPVTTLLGGDAVITPRVSADGTVSLGDADPDIADPKIVVPDVMASNGNIQGIDRVLLPIDL